MVMGELGLPGWIKWLGRVLEMVVGWGSVIGELLRRGEVECCRLQWWSGLWCLSG